VMLMSAVLCVLSSGSARLLSNGRLQKVEA
jgi:hypothetical protein